MYQQMFPLHDADITIIMVVAVAAATAVRLGLVKWGLLEKFGWVVRMAAVLGFAFTAFTLSIGYNAMQALHASQRVEGFAILVISAFGAFAWALLFSSARS